MVQHLSNKLFLDALFDSVSMFLSLNLSFSSLPCSILKNAKKNTNKQTNNQKRVDDLHQSQLLAYREAATEALREWARTMAPLPPMEDHDTQHTFVERCVSTLVTSTTSPWPQWRIPTAKMIVSLEMRKRARATFAKYHQDDPPAEPDKEAAVAVAAPEQEPAKDDAAQVSNDEDNAEENVDENDEEGEVDEEEGEMEDEDDNDEDDGPLDDEAGAGKAASSHAGGKKKNFKGQNKRKKVIARKKATNAKQTVQARKGGAARGRRPRGGGVAGSK